MAAPTTAGGSQIRCDPVAHLTVAPEAATSPEVLAWPAEAKRFFTESEDRVEGGEVLPALSSLAAVPPLHRMLVERCAELLDGDDRDDAKEAPPQSGTYL